MIVKPVFIIGPPRSGTSTLFHILRSIRPFWSLPSEGEEIWKLICHPERNGWQSEECHQPESISQEDRQLVRKLYERRTMPYLFWRYFVHPESIWKSSSSTSYKKIRSLNASLYLSMVSLIYFLNPFHSYLQRRLVDKSVDSCLRLELIKSIFPDIRFVFVCRHGLDSIKSMINGWLNPYRFGKYKLPEPLEIEGYRGTEWNFILPEDWRKMNGCHLVEICTWQWSQCIERILEFEKMNPEIVMRLKLEDLIADPRRQLERLAHFINIPAEYFDPVIQDGIPKINTTPATQENFPFPDHLKKITEHIRQLMYELGYD